MTRKAPGVGFEPTRPQEATSCLVLASAQTSPGLLPTWLGDPGKGNPINIFAMGFLFLFNKEYSVALRYLCFLQFSKNWKILSKRAILL
jgi:hypothetical protein